MSHALATRKSTRKSTRRAALSHLSAAPTMVTKRQVSASWESMAQRTRHQPRELAAAAGRGEHSAQVSAGPAPRAWAPEAE